MKLLQRHPHASCQVRHSVLGCHLVHHPNRHPLPTVHNGVGMQEPQVERPQPDPVHPQLFGKVLQGLIQLQGVGAPRDSDREALGHTVRHRPSAEPPSVDGVHADLLRVTPHLERRLEDHLSRHRPPATPPQTPHRVADRHQQPVRHLDLDHIVAVCIHGHRRDVCVVPHRHCQVAEWQQFQHRGGVPHDLDRQAPLLRHLGGQHTPRRHVAVPVHSVKAHGRHPKVAVAGRPRHVHVPRVGAPHRRKPGRVRHRPQREPKRSPESRLALLQATHTPHSSLLHVRPHELQPKLKPLKRLVLYGKGGEDTPHTPLAHDVEHWHLQVGPCRVCDIDDEVHSNLSRVLRQRQEHRDLVEPRYRRLLQHSHPPLVVDSNRVELAVEHNPRVVRLLRRDS
mmetsp:Transcript_39642/g.99221  ORF Transcript_39642/g.99221 Transcript_39642/m.99221 type:complete len:395 (-) Transcript_39642:936-2120(-)